MFSCLKIDLTEKVLEKERMNTYLTNILIVAIVGMLCWAIGWQSFLLVHGSIFLIAGSIGIWLFYVQHTFEDSYFEEDKEWEYVKAAVEGSSFYKLPKILQFLTGNIGFHHVHHLSPRVPNYKLEEAHNNTLPLKMYQQLRLLQACVHSVSVFGMRKVTILLALKMSKI